MMGPRAGCSGSSGSLFYVSIYFGGEYHKQLCENENPDAIINIVDATNLSRSLFFTTQLLELGVPVVVALNKSDITDKKADKD